MHTTKSKKCSVRNWYENLRLAYQSYNPPCANGVPVCSEVSRGAVAFVSLTDCATLPGFQSIMADIKVPLVQVDYECPDVDFFDDSGSGGGYLYRYPPAAPDIGYTLHGVLDNLQWNNVAFVYDEGQGKAVSEPIRNIAV